MTSSTLFGDTEFVLIREPISFQEGIVACRSRHANVARVSNETEHRAVKELFEEAEQTLPVWLGLVDFEQIGGNTTERSTFVHGSQDGLDFFASHGNFLGVLINLMTLRLLSIV